MRLEDSGAVVTYAKKSQYHYEWNVTMSGGRKIQLGSFKDLVSVKVAGGNGTSPHLASSVGLMGHYDNKGARVARDGQTVLEDPNAFGQEWQVNHNDPLLFRTKQAPQFPEACVMPTATASGRRRLGETLARNAAEEACAHWGEKKDMCVYDTLATGDLDMAHAGPF